MRATSLPWLATEDLFRLKYCPNCDYCLRGLPARHRCPECGFVYDEKMFDLYGWSLTKEHTSTQVGWPKLIPVLSPFLVWLIALVMTGTRLSFQNLSSIPLGMLAVALGLTVLAMLALKQRRQSDHRPPVRFLFTAAGFAMFSRAGDYTLTPWTYPSNFWMSLWDRNRKGILLSRFRFELRALVPPMMGVLELDTASAKKVKHELQQRITLAGGELHREEDWFRRLCGDRLF